MSVFKDDQTTYTGNLTVLGAFTVGGTTGSVSGPMIITRNTATAPDTSNAWSPGKLLAQFVGADGNLNAPVVIDAFGLAEASLHLTQARGTGAAPTATQTGDHIGTFNMDGFYTSGGPAYIQGVALLGRATDNYTSTTTGTAFDIYTTPAGTAAIANTATFDASSGLTMHLGNLGFSVSGKGILGTTTNDSAAAGVVGEYIESVILIGSAVSLVTGTPKTITSILLTAGDWDVDASIDFIPGGAAVVTQLVASISGTTNALDLSPGRISTLNATLTTGSGGTETISAYRFSLAGNSTVFLVAQSNFSSTNTAYGIVRARRVR